MATVETLGNVASLGYFIPELVLTAAVLVILLADIFGAERKDIDSMGLLALGGTLTAFFAHVGLYAKPPVFLFEGMLAHDMFSAFFRGFFLLATAIVILMTLFSREVIYLKKGEFYAILLPVTIGMCLVSASADLVIFYLSLELLSIGSYLLAGFSRTVGRSDEAALKYVLYGGVSTGVLLFGLSLLYGLTGTTSFAGIQAALTASQSGYDLAAYVIFLMFLVGAGYKIAAAPFHFWAPDVYEGAPTPVTAYLSVASKGAGFALLIRFFYSTMLRQPAAGGPWLEAGALNLDWTFHIALLSVVTMTLGNLAAIVQTNLKRLLAYSGIAHAGYVLMGVCALSDRGLEAVIFYLVIYLFTNLAAFLVVIMMVEAAGDERLAGLRGLWSRSPYTTVLMTIALFSLIGLPPTGGFVGKYILFIAVLQEKLYWLAVAAALNTVVSLYYYARIIKAMLLEDAPAAGTIHFHPAYTGLLVALTVPVLYFGIWWDPLIRYARYCVTLLHG
ncbi:MAG: NADH-quinone oxidoreductase subunit N [bacterium]